MVIDLGVAESLEQERERARVASLREAGQSLIDHVFEGVLEPLGEGVTDFGCVD